MYVRCPSCEKIHCHSINGNYTIRQRRLSHCAFFCNYEIRIPCSEAADDVGYEIDISPLSAQDFSTLRKWTEATETTYFDKESCGNPCAYTSRWFDWVFKCYD